MTQAYRTVKLYGSKTVHAIYNGTTVSPCFEVSVLTTMKVKAKLTCETCMAEVMTKAWLQDSETVDSV